MDVKRTTQFAWLFSFALVLSLGKVSLATADERTVTDANVTSTIFITDDSVGEPPSLPKFRAPQLNSSKSATGSLVFVDDVSKPKTLAPSATVQAATMRPLPPVVESPATAPRGDLKVISNRHVQPALEAIRPEAQQQPSLPIVQQPAVSDQRVKQAVAVQPVANTQPVADVQSVDAPAERDQPGDIQVAVHEEPLPTAKVAPVVKLTSVEEQLISAHDLSLQAVTVADYSQIIQDCAVALRQGAQGEQRGFALQLSSWSFNRRGQLRADEGEQELANADFQASIDFNPRNWRALHNRGVSFAQTGQLAEAFDDFNTVIQLKPDYAKAYANRATLYAQARDLQAAMKDYEQAIQRDNEFATAYVGLGRICHMLGLLGDSIKHFTTAVQLEPTRPDIVCSRGDLHADRGEYGAALADYARTIELDPEFAHAYRNGAWLLATCPDDQYRDSHNAVLGAKQAMEFHYGEQHVALDTLAAALASNGQFSDAIATVAQAVELAPEDAKFTYLSRMQLYQDHEPFRTEAIEDVSQVTYEANDQSTETR